MIQTTNSMLLVILAPEANPVPVALYINTTR